MEVVPRSSTKHAIFNDYYSPKMIHHLHEKCLQYLAEPIVA